MVTPQGGSCIMTLKKVDETGDKSWNFMLNVSKDQEKIQHISDDILAAFSPSFH